MRTVLGEAKGGAGGLGAQSTGKRGEHGSLPVRELGEQLPPVTSRALRKTGQDVVVEHGVPGGDGTHGLCNLAGCSRLDQVAMCPCCQSCAYLVRTVEGSEHQDPGVWAGLPDTDGGTDPVSVGHAQVENRDVRPAFRCGRDRGVPGTHLRHHLNVRLGIEHRAQSIAEHRMVVGDQNADRHGDADPSPTAAVGESESASGNHAATSVPSWAPERMERVPPTEAVRVAMDSSPTPRRRSSGMLIPSSVTVSATPPFFAVIDTRQEVPPECRAALQMASLATRSTATSTVGDSGGK